MKVLVLICLVLVLGCSDSGMEPEYWGKRGWDRRPPVVRECMVDTVQVVAYVDE